MKDRQRPAAGPVLDFTLVHEAEAPGDLAADDLESLTAYILGEEGSTDRWEIAVALVDDTRLQSLHRDFMGVDVPTDVMTFPGDESGGARTGDIVISVEHARAEAAAWDHSPSEEVQFLVAHGVLHLLGWRDETPEERAAMLERQQSRFDAWRRSRAVRES